MQKLKFHYRKDLFENVKKGDLLQYEDKDDYYSCIIIVLKIEKYRQISGFATVMGRITEVELNIMDKIEHYSIFK